MEATERGYLAFGLTQLGRIGVRLLDGLAASLPGEPQTGPVAWLVVAVAGAAGLAAAAEWGMGGTAAEVTELADREHDLGALFF